MSRRNVGASYVTITDGRASSGQVDYLLFFDPVADALTLSVRAFQIRFRFRRS